LIEDSLAWLASLPSSAVYLMIGLATLVENALPPVPSDVAVALGGFLSQQGPIDAWVVFLAAWAGAVAGAAALYLISRRYGRRFFATRLGRRLLTPDAMLIMEREYLRFGTGGILVARLIPGFRWFVAPFAGLVNLSASTTLVPVALAAALWYGLLTWAGAQLGAEWETIARFLSRLNRTLAIGAVVAGVLLAVYLARRPRRRPRYERLLRVIDRALGETPEAGTAAAPGGSAAEAAASALMYALARFDLEITPEERRVIEAHFRQAWELAPPELRPSAPFPSFPLDETREVATAVAGQYDRARRLQLLERLWRIAGADGTLSRHEDRLMRRAGELLGLSVEDLAEVRARVSP
jgi:membrane protein DedA with SNARE-associated domain